MGKSPLPIIVFSLMLYHFNSSLHTLRSSSFTVRFMWNIFAVPPFPFDFVLGSKSICDGLRDKILLRSAAFSYSNSKWKLEHSIYRLPLFRIKIWAFLNYCRIVNCNYVPQVILHLFLQFDFGLRKWDLPGLFLTKISLRFIFCE